MSNPINKSIILVLKNDIREPKIFEGNYDRNPSETNGHKNFRMIKIIRVECDISSVMNALSLVYSEIIDALIQIRHFIYERASSLENWRLLKYDELNYP